MTNLQAALAGYRYHDELRFLRDTIPELSAVPLGLIEAMYEKFSEDIYCASWMGNAQDHWEHFQSWLGEEARR